MLRRLYLVSVFVLVSFSIYAQVSPKRGLAYGYHSVADLTEISQGASWWYNWSDTPDGDVVATYPSLGIEFVPMFWNATFDVNTAIANIPAGAKYILAFNEPNFTVESNMTPAQAVANWSRIEQVAASRNLEIVSASPAYCGGGVCVSGYTNPITWHDEFFALCPTCKVDYIAFHCYETYTGGLFALVNNLKVYNRPLWITEFACWDPAQNATFKNDYLTDAVSTFENDPDIYRYSWFTGRRPDNPSIDILGASGVLTSLGTSYINASYGPIGAIPGTIQTETNYRRRGINNEACTDVGGGQNIAFMDNGDWAEYLVNVNALGNYLFQFRVASLVNAGLFDIYVDDQLVKADVTFPATGGYQTWTTLNVPTVTLPAGEHLLKFRFKASGFNINYFTTSFESTVPPTVNFSATPLTRCIGEQITFSDLTTNTIGTDTYAWNFGTDATPATTSTAGPHNVSYSSAGQKTISLQVTNTNGGNTTTKTNYITIVNAPVSNAGINQTVTSNTTSLFATLPSGTGVWTTVSGYGNFNNTTSPTTSVSNLAVGASTFRWTVTDVCSDFSDVTVTYTPVSSVNGIKSINGILLSPNPFKEFTYLKIDGDGLNASMLKVIDMRGIVVKEITIEPGESIEFGNELTSGLYTAIITRGDDVTTIRLVKQ